MGEVSEWLVVDDSALTEDDDVPGAVAGHVGVDDSCCSDAMLTNTYQSPAVAERQATTDCIDDLAAWTPEAEAGRRVSADDASNTRCVVDGQAPTSAAASGTGRTTTHVDFSGGAARVSSSPCSSSSSATNNNNKSKGAITSKIKHAIKLSCKTCTQLYWVAPLV